MTESSPNQQKLATFAAGCFWGVEELFRELPGVIKTEVGYTGGHTENPTYEDVCGHRTGHAEAVQITYDPARIGYDRLLDVFWNNHNPTTLNRQGPDVGSQYRSAVFYHDQEQAEVARASRDKLEQSGRFRSTVVTEITPAPVFYPAESYHQQYLLKRGPAACHI
jgi:peptide-methionine (S)-S-oxide reductase